MPVKVATPLLSVVTSNAPDVASIPGRSPPSRRRMTMVPVATVPPRRTVTARSRGLTMRMVAPAVADRPLLSVAVTMRS